MSGVLRAAAAAVVLDPPVDPDAPTGRRWAREELLDPIYHQHRSVLQRVLDWIQQQLAGLRAPGLPSPAAGALILLAVAVVVLVAFLVTGPVRRNRRAARRQGAVLDVADRRTAAQLRDAADAAATRGDWTTAVLERFRAIVRGLEERVVLDEQPGRTADEATAAAAARLPAVADELAAAGRLFDDVAYGGAAAGPPDDARLRATETAVRAAHPAPARDAAAALAVPR
jgi:hypothetical protein